MRLILTILVLISVYVVLAESERNSTRLKRAPRTYNRRRGSNRPTSTTEAKNGDKGNSTASSATEDSCFYKGIKPSFSKPGRRISEEKCLEYIWERVNREKETKSIECYRKKSGLMHHHAIGGRNTAAGEFPHMGALGWRTVEGGWAFRCGCTLISEKFAITAGHCSSSVRDTNIVNRKPEIVRLKNKYIGDKSHHHGVLTKDVKIARIIVHPNYKAPIKYYDIAIVQLAESLQFQFDMQPACLWSHSNTHKLGTSATVTGWGVTNVVTKQVTAELQAVDVDFIDSETCDRLLKKSRNRNWGGITNNQICAGKLAGGADACQGDSGGPLQVKIALPQSKEGSMHYMVGVTSFGIGCAQPNLPGVYTRVASFVDWIESVVWPQQTNN